MPGLFYQRSASFKGLECGVDDLSAAETALETEDGPRFDFEPLGLWSVDIRSFNESVLPELIEDVLFTELSLLTVPLQSWAWWPFSLPWVFASLRLHREAVSVSECGVTIVKVTFSFIARIVPTTTSCFSHFTSFPFTLTIISPTLMPAS